MTSRRLLATAGLALALALTACAPEPGSPTASPTTSSPSPTSTSSPTHTPTPSATVSAGDIELPSSCEQIYSADMLASLTAQNPPLNDPGVTMHSTQNAELLETLNSGIPTLRCSWGLPSEYGLATNVSIVDPAQSAALLATLESTGYGCESHAVGTICRIQQKTIDQDDNEVTLGESHFLAGNGWVSTAYVNFAPTGYTEDIVATLWG